MRIKSVNIHRALRLVPEFVLKETENMIGRKEGREEGGRADRNVP